jgi:hypothetical protein
VADAGADRSMPMAPRSGRRLSSVGRRLSSAASRHSSGSISSATASGGSSADEEIVPLTLEDFVGLFVMWGVTTVVIIMWNIAEARYGRRVRDKVRQKAAEIKEELSHAKHASHALAASRVSAACRKSMGPKKQQPKGGPFGGLRQCGFGVTSACLCAGGHVADAPPDALALRWAVLAFPKE